jgi:hypothetical protein
MMKKILLLLTVFSLVCFMACGAMADMTFVNNTLVEGWINATHPVSGFEGDSIPAPGKPGWYDRIGQTIFETFGGRLITSTNTLVLETNWGPANNVDLTATTADLFFDIDGNGSWDYAVGLSAARSGQVYQNPAYATSVDKFNGNGLGYGGQYDYASPKLVPVEATSGLIKTDASMVSYDAVSGHPWSYEISIDLNKIAPNFAFTDALWGTATCGNDTFQAHVPIPGAILLLGAGLAGLAAYARRRQDI